MTGLTGQRPVLQLGTRPIPCVIGGVLRALSELTLSELQLQLTAWGFKPVHASRVLRAFYPSGGELADDTARPFPAGLLEKIRAELPAATATLAVRQVADDGTTKLLLRLADARTVETVLMPDFRADRAAGCVSSQVGCAMGCDFCATTKTGFERNLTAGEIVEQFLALRREASAIFPVPQTEQQTGLQESTQLGLAGPRDPLQLDRRRRRLLQHVGEVEMDRRAREPINLRPASARQSGRAPIGRRIDERQVGAGHADGPHQMVQVMALGVGRQSHRRRRLALHPGQRLARHELDPGPAFGRDAAVQEVDRERSAIVVAGGQARGIAIGVAREQRRDEGRGADGCVLRRQGRGRRRARGGEGVDRVELLALVEVAADAVERRQVVSLPGAIDDGHHGAAAEPGAPLGARQAGGQTGIHECDIAVVLAQRDPGRDETANVIERAVERRHRSVGEPDALDRDAIDEFGAALAAGLARRWACV